MRLNYYLPKYDFVEKHKININSSKEKVFQAIWSLDINKSKIIRILFSLRGIYGMLGLGKRPANLEHIGLSFEELIKKPALFTFGRPDCGSLTLSAKG
ncbi:MAG: hypothetical protein VR69_02390 [Peptococcaceae bacterium BRH_c4b]|nr:MAG: hypothetical protein VR69_02390 [Peptococcaceae bacterium BRH_c4b]